MNWFQKLFHQHTWKLSLIYRWRDNGDLLALRQFTCTECGEKDEPILLIVARAEDIREADGAEVVGKEGSFSTPTASQP